MLGDPNFWTSIRPVVSAGNTADASRLIEFIRLAPPAAVLDCGCGIGGHAFAFHDMGFDTTGVDLTEQFIHEATASRTPGPKFIHDDIRHFVTALTHPIYDLITFFATTIIGYFPRVEDDIAFLNNVRRILKPSGTLIIEAANRELLRQRPLREYLDGESLLRQHFMLRGNNLLDTEITRLHRGETTHHFQVTLRLYSGAEIIDILREAGFQANLIASFDGTPYQEDTPSRLIAVAKPSLSHLSEQ